MILANPVNPAMIGKDLVDVPDADGKLFRREILELAKKKGKGWVDYKFKNPASGKVEPRPPTSSWSATSPSKRASTRSKRL